MHKFYNKSMLVMERTIGRDKGHRLLLESSFDPSSSRFERPNDFITINSKYPKLRSPV